jgi:hypothetical protein
MQPYPIVLDEFDTLRAVCAGRSLARFGDGEFKLCGGRDIKSQRHDPELGRRLRGILRDSGDCLVGIPNLRANTPKMKFWTPYLAVASLLADRPYASAFISRPDSAPWIDTPAYWDALASLWRGQDVTLVRGSEKSLMVGDMVGAGAVTEIVAPRQHAWANYAELLERIGRPQRALLCLGPTATVLAVDLCARGVHAIDLGHVALFWRKHLRGEPMTLTKDEKAWP